MHIDERSVSVSPTAQEVFTCVIGPADTAGEPPPFTCRPSTCHQTQLTWYSVGQRSELSITLSPRTQTRLPSIGGEALDDGPERSERIFSGASDAHAAGHGHSESSLTGAGAAHSADDGDEKEPSQPSLAIKNMEDHASQAHSNEKVVYGNLHRVILNDGVDTVIYNPGHRRRAAVYTGGDGVWGRRLSGTSSMTEGQAILEGYFHARDEAASR